MSVGGDSSAQTHCFRTWVSTGDQRLIKKTAVVVLNNEYSEGNKWFDLTCTQDELTAFGVSLVTDYLTRKPHLTVTSGL